jgi:hypothetical protein
MTNNKYNTDMRKTIFEGVINGQVYNNVKEYNDVITTLLANGETFTASTSTKTIDVCDNCESEQCKCCECEAPAQPNVNLHFGFDFEEPLADHYLSMDEDNEETMGMLEEEMNAQLDGISTIIKGMSLGDLNAYLKDVNTIGGELKDLEDANDAAMEEIENKLCFLADSSVLHQMFIEYYDNIKSMIVDRVAELANDNCHKQVVDKSVCDNECKIRTAVNEVIPQKETDIIKAFGKIFNDVFKDVDHDEIKKILNL